MSKSVVKMKTYFGGYVIAIFFGGYVQNIFTELVKKLNITSSLAKFLLNVLYIY